MIQFERLIAVRLVSHDAAALADFYCAALGFERGASAPIAAEEMDSLGVTGTGLRIFLERPNSSPARGGGPAKLVEGHAGRGDELTGSATAPVPLHHPAGGPPPRAGEELTPRAVLEIDQFDPPGQPYPPNRASDDRLFQHFAMVTADLPEAWAQVLAAGGLPISTAGPVQLPPENGSVQAVKFRDPDGHPLELLAFPQPGNHPLAIDHSAIVVRDVTASINFYQARGLVAGDRTVNHGPAQAALDGLIAPRVDVVPLNPPGAGPHLELLGYHDLAPRMPVEWTARDVAATRLVWAAAEPGLVTDPDGHLHQCLKVR